MTQMEKLFFIVLLVNTLTAAGYFLWNTYGSKKEEKHRTEYLIKTIVMLICPVVGPAFFAAGYIIPYLFFRQALDLEDVVFSKERADTYLRADTEREMNVVPMEEALAISDKDSLRSLMMNVVRGDIQNSLSSIALALNSEDSETAHYAATVLRDTLNDFRKRVYELNMIVKQGGEDAAEYAILMIEYMNPVLVQNVFSDMEQKSYVDMMEQACDYLYTHAKTRLTAQHIERLCVLLLKIKDMEKMEVWCGRSRAMYPNELATYTAYLKYYFVTDKREAFFEELDRLKHSDIVIDRETLELIRTFS